MIPSGKLLNRITERALVTRSQKGAGWYGQEGVGRARQVGCVQSVIV